MTAAFPAALTVPVSTPLMQAAAVYAWTVIGRVFAPSTRPTITALTLSAALTARKMTGVANACGSPGLNGALVAAV